MPIFACGDPGFDCSVQAWMINIMEACPIDTDTCSWYMVKHRKCFVVHKKRRRLVCRGFVCGMPAQPKDAGSLSAIPVRAELFAEGSDEMRGMGVSALDFARLSLLAESRKRIPALSFVA
jgi:hypothetical protein